MHERSLDDTIIQTAQAEAVAPVVRRAERAERRSSRGLKAAVAVSILGMFLSFLWNGYNTREIVKNETQYVITQQGLESLKQANKELRDRGLPEIPVPREGDRLDADALAAAAAAILKDDITGDPAFRGRPGRPGEDCTPQVPGCTGQPGKAGSDGARGPEGPKAKDGLNATDEQVGRAVEAYCSRPTNPCVGPMGPAGPQGVQGVPGEPGQMGPEGPFCPEGFEARKKIIVTDDNAFDLLLVCDEL